MMVKLRLRPGMAAMNALPFAVRPLTAPTTPIRKLIDNG